MQFPVEVPAVGPPDALIAFVGEAPGQEEARQGRPFIGVSGRLLTDIMGQVGINREACYITNVIKQRPINNDITQFLDISKTVPKHTEAYEAYLEQLRYELEVLKPNLVVAVGATALYALTGKKEVLKWRGSILPCALVPGLKVLPVVHPAMALREYKMRHLIQFDLVKAVEQSQFPGLVYKPREYILGPDFYQAMQYLEECRQQPLVAFDIEVIGRREVSCISFSYSPEHAISIPFMRTTGGDPDYFRPEEEVEIWRMIQKVLADDDIQIVGQNISFDTSFLFRRYGIVTTHIHDTMVAAGVLFPDLPKGLDFITSLYTDIPFYKDDGKERHRGGNVSDEDYWLYNAKDSIVLMEAFPQQLAELQRQGNVETYLRQVGIIEPFLYMSERGVRVDEEGLKVEHDRIVEEVDKLRTELHQLCGFEINDASPQQLANYFYKLKGLPPYKNRKTGAVTTDDKALKRIARKGFREATIIQDMRSLRKLDSTYITVKRDEDRRLRGAINIVGTKTGRVSSSKSIFRTGGNMQNLPEEMRRFIIPDPGHVIYELDLSQAENRIVAVVGNEMRMLDAFETGQDVHSLTASLIFGGPADKAYQSAQKAPIGDRQASNRDWGKKANHGLNYDLGYKTFAFIYEIEEKDAKLIVDRYHEAYPGVRRYHRIVQDELKNGLTLTNLHGRKRLFLDRWGDEMFKEAYSYIPQSTVADHINPYGVHYIYDQPDAFPDVELLNQVHDSIWIQVPLEVGWQRHADIVNAVQASLQQPLVWRDHEFVIPSTIKLYARNLEKGAEFERAVTAADLRDAYNNSVK